MNQRIYQRQKLYEEVWSEPVTSVASRYGVSDVAIRKACKRLNVPLPARGYWAKLSAGHNVKKQPLPAHNGPTFILRPSSHRPDLQRSSQTKERLLFLEEAERNKILQICDNLQVQDRLTNIHPLIKQDQETRAERKRMERERGSLNYWNDDYQGNYRQWSALANRLLNISVYHAYLPRAYRIQNTIFRTIEEIGGSIRQNEQRQSTEIILFGEPIAIQLKGREHDFTITIEEYRAPRKNWRDTKTKQLEIQVGSFIVGLLECAHILRTIREERQREERLRLQRELERHEREERRKREMERLQELEQAALDWQKARIIEQYVAELEKLAENEPDDEKRNKLLAHISWAREKVDWLDPLVGKDDPILGKRHQSYEHD